MIVMATVRDSRPSRKELFCRMPKPAPVLYIRCILRNRKVIFGVVFTIRYFVS